MQIFGTVVKSEMETFPIFINFTSWFAPEQVLVIGNCQVEAFDALGVDRTSAVLTGSPFTLTNKDLQRRVKSDAPGGVYTIRFLARDNGQPDQNTLTAGLRLTVVG